METSQPKKPTIRVCTLGHVDHGKSTLTSALSKLYGSDNAEAYKIDKAPEDEFGGITINATYVEYDSDTRHYLHIDCSSDADFVKYMITRAGQIDGAILVYSVHAVDLLPQTREQLLLCHQTGVPCIIMFLTNTENLDDIDYGNSMRYINVDFEVHTLINTTCGIDAKTIYGSPHMALSGGDEIGMGTSAVKEVVQAMDSDIPDPLHEIDIQFLMSVDEVISVGRNETIVSGTVVRGMLRLEDEVEIIGLRDTVRTSCMEIKIDNAPASETIVGRNVSVSLRDLKHAYVRRGEVNVQVERGQVLVRPGSVQGRTQFDAVVYVPSKEEGGGSIPLLSSPQLQFHFRAADVTGSCKLPEDVEKVMPGGYSSVSVTLTQAVAMEKGQRFSIFDGGNIVAVGRVTAIPKR